jgi:type IV secretory pathway protease TraF
VGHRRLTPVAAAAAAAVACGLAALAPPARYEVVGLSMAPGLLPGDVVTTGMFPAADRWRRPRRFECWMLTAPDGTPAIKRVVGLPGETVSIRAGDLAVGGRGILAPPGLLAQTAAPLPEPLVATAAADADGGCWQRSVSIPIVYDDAAFAPAERRMLLPVRDVGLAAVIRPAEPPTGTQPLQVRVRIDDAVVGWSFETGGRFALVAGRLDGQLVAAAWPLAASDRWPAEGRSALPPRPPSAWDVCQAMPEESRPQIDDRPRRLGLWLARAGVPLGVPEADAAIERVAAWRDVLWRTAADGRDAWRLGPDEYFLLGDFPSGSRDARHWGPLRREALRHRAVLTASAR